MAKVLGKLGLTQTDQTDASKNIIQKLTNRVYNVYELLSTTVAGSLSSQEIEEYKALLVNHDKLIKWFEVEYEKFSNLNELNQITNLILLTDNRSEDQISTQYLHGLSMMRKYITYYQDITRRIISIFLALKFYEEKKEEYKKLKLADAKINISSAIEGSKRAKLLVYLKNTSYFLKSEAKWMNMTIKSDLVFLNKRMQEIIKSLQDLQQ